MFDLRLNGHTVVFEVRVETEPGEGWKGSRSIGIARNLEQLNDLIWRADPDLYWRTVVDIQDDLDHPENQKEHHWACTGCNICGSSGKGGSWN